MADDEAGTAGRPDHVIRPDAVDDWLADSVIKTVTYHRTTPWDAEDIVEHGVDIARSQIGAFGQGFYSATISEAWRGPSEVRVAIKTRNPLVGSVREVESVIDEIGRRLHPRLVGLNSQVAVSIRQELLVLGYDGIVIRDAGGDGIDYVVAILGETARVVVPS